MFFAASRSAFSEWAHLTQANRLRFTVRGGPDVLRPSSVSDDNADIVHKSFCLK
jgi:hypothetical protein